jgi:chloride channel protein, CIC family
VTAAPEAPHLSGAAYLRLILLGAVIGVPAALVAAGFLALVHESEDWLWHDLPDALGESAPPWYLIVGLPVVGAVVVLAARKLLPGDGGHSPLDGIGAKPTPISHAPSVALAALGSLAFGAVIGPEAPLIALGSVVGVAASAILRLGEREHAVLGLAGSSSAISALFGGPLPASVLLVEAGLAKGSALIPILIPGLVAAACGYMIFVGIGDWGGLDATSLTVPGLPPYDGAEVGDLLVASLVGVAAGLMVVIIHREGRRVASLREGGLGMVALLLAGGLAVGCLGVVADALGAETPEVFFSGQSGVPDIIAEGSVGVVIVVLLAKAAAYGICLGCGFRGGPVFPAIFTGVALATIAVIALDMSPTVAVAAGTAAGMAAATRLLISSLVVAALLVGTGGLDAIPAAVLAAVAAWLTVNALEPAQSPAPAHT